MKTFKIVAILVVALAMTRCAEDPIAVEEEAQEEQVPKNEIDRMILQSLQDHDEFNWNSVSDQVLWSALLYSDSVLTIGYQPVNEKNVNGRITAIDVSDKTWQEAREAVIQEALGALQKKNARQMSREETRLKVHEVLPFLEMKVADIEVITRLRKLPGVRYVEPLGYEVDFSTLVENGKTKSSKGCSNEADFGIPASDFTIISPGAKLSWNYQYMNIPSAWNYSTGSGITIGLIDTGLSAGQDKLGSQFNSGVSTGRYLRKYGTYVSSWWWWASPDGPDDQCGHGTAMAGTIAAPRTSNHSPVGVAYNANLVSVRGTGDVVINGGKEKTGVADALVLLGDRTDVRIISMSIGDVFTNSKVADAVRYAYGKGKLIFSAAGTSPSFTNWYGVIFPATMAETVAVTGIKEGGGYARCDVCHSGDKVDFTIVMERPGSKNHPLTLAMNGNQPSTVGGSSVATATAAGIAALTWSKNPSLSRDEMLSRLKQAAELYPNRDSQYGWGTLDALKAVL